MAFGIAAEKMGSNATTAAGIADLDTLQVWLFNNYPELANLKISIAVNKNIVLENILLHNGDEVALLPPFSGG